VLELVGYTGLAMTTAHAQNAVTSLLVGGKIGAELVSSVIA
jgi:hypothetical protein